MAAFVDAYLPERILGFGFVSTPRWSTNITQVASGAENRNQNWLNPLHRFTAPEAIRCWEDIASLHEMWMAFAGPAYSFAFRDPLDFASRRLAKPNTAPEIFATDQPLGIGDGFTTTFQLVKQYVYGGRTYSRTIAHPVVDSVLVAMNALPAGTGDPPLDGGPYFWEVDRLTGVVTFDPAPAEGVVLTAGFLFDVEARFEDDDSYDGIVKAFELAEVASLTLLEVRPC